MTVLTFDPIKFAKRLEDAGCSHNLALAEAEALAEVLVKELHAISIKTKAEN